MSIEIDAGLLAVVVKDLGITIPVRSACKLKGGAVEVWTRDGSQVWKPPVKKTASKRVSNPTPSGAKPAASRKRVTSAKKEAKSETDD